MMKRSLPSLGSARLQPLQLRESIARTTQEDQVIQPITYYIFVE